MTAKPTLTDRAIKIKNLAHSTKHNEFDDFHLVGYIREVLVEVEQEGRRGVVEWVIDNYDNGLFLDDWRAKLKEWEL